MSSVERVEAAAAAAGLAIAVRRMDTSTRTAQEAADACGCALAQIVKSLVFEGQSSKNLFFFLVCGVAPLGHTAPLVVFADETLLAFSTVFAAAGAPDALFEADPVLLFRAANATPADLG